MHKKHPARYSEHFIPIFAELVGDAPIVLDPMAGTGERLQQLSKLIPNTKIIGIELEPEWASITPSIVQVGSILSLPFADNSIHTILVSPPYGNRMADKEKPTSTRISYASYLQRPLMSNNAGGLHWGAKYRDFFINAWDECARVNSDRFILNIKDFYQDFEVIPVTQWHIDTLENMGYYMIEHKQVEVKSMKRGRNSELRVPYESIIVFQKDETYVNA